MGGKSELKTSARKAGTRAAGRSGLSAALPGVGGSRGGSAATVPALQDPRGKYPKPPFARQTQPWPGLASKMDPRPDHGENSYRGSGRLAGRRALITGGDSGMGRAAAIAYAREGADVAINYLPMEEPDAQEVIQLIGQAGQGVAIPAICARRPSASGWSPRPWRSSAASTYSSAMPAASRRTPRSSNHDRGLRCHDEDQHLRAVLDHQGGTAASASRARPSSARPPSRPTIPRRSCTTTPRPRRPR